MIQVTKSEAVMIICNVALALCLFYACGQAQALRESVLRMSDNRIVIPVPASDRTNYSTLNQTYETNR